MPPDAVDLAVVPRDVLDLCERLRSKGKRAWIVGGCVRDLLLGRQAADWDVATDARPKELLGIFPRAIPTGIEHGTVTVVKEGHHYEVTTLRGEGTYSDGRRPDWVEFVDDITADLARRDFTVNAIAVDPLDGKLIDPFDGRGDLGAGPAARRRRSARALLRGRPARPARGALRRDARADPRPRHRGGHRADAGHLPQGRRRARARRVAQGDEGAPALARLRRDARAPASSPSPAPSSSRASTWSRTSGTPTTSGATAWSAWTPARPIPVLRVAAMLHDVGKPRTRAWSEKTKDWTFYDHDRVGAEIAEPIAERLRFSNDERERIVALVRFHLFHYSDEWTDAAVRRWIRRVGADRLDGSLPPQPGRRPRQGPRLRAGPRRRWRRSRRTSRASWPRAPRSRRGT